MSDAYEAISRLDQWCRSGGLDGSYNQSGDMRRDIQTLDRAVHGEAEDKPDRAPLDLVLEGVVTRLQVPDDRSGYGNTMVTVRMHKQDNIEKIWWRKVRITLVDEDDES